jgi:hypothetical protein
MPAGVSVGVSTLLLVSYAKSPTLEQFRTAFDCEPGRLAVWAYGGDAVELVLRCLELSHAAEVRRAPVPELIPRLSRALQDAEGAFVRWGSTRPVNEGHPKDGLTRRDFQAVRSAMTLARDWAPIEQALISAEHGQQHYESHQREIRFPLLGDIRRDVFDRMVGQPFGMAPDISLVGEEMDILRGWVARGPSGPTDMTDNEFRAARRLARNLRSQAPREFPSVTQLPGFTLQEAHLMWDKIYADAYLASTLTFTHQDLWATILVPDKELLVRELGRVVADESAAGAFVEFMTFKSGYHPDPAIAPIIDRGDWLILPPGLVLNSSFERNLMRSVALDPGLNGRIGDLRGQMGVRQVASFFKAFPDALVAMNLTVTSRGKDLGDLDVVSIDPVRKVGAILEVKWPASVDHMVEILRIAEMAGRAQQQLAGLRRALVSREASVHGWPDNWPAFEAIDWTYLVLVKDHVPSPIVGESIQILNWDILWSQRGDSLRGTLQRLSEQRYLPAEGVDYERVWRAARLGPYRVEIESFELAHPSADPRDLSRLFATELSG